MSTKIPLQCSSFIVTKSGLFTDMIVVYKVTNSHVTTIKSNHDSPLELKTVEIKKINDWVKSSVYQ